MIINGDYKINKISNEIIYHQKIKISCDKCGKIKETEYGEWKNRLNKNNDYCKGCSNILGITGCKGRKSKGRTIRRFNCEYCDKEILRYERTVKKYKHIFCSQDCNMRSNYDRRYGHLINNYSKYHDKLCYLMGAILGDGTISNIGKNTKQIAIYCDASDGGDIGVMKNITGVLDDIRINYFITNNRSNCRAITFNFPNEALTYFGMLFSGDKFKAQPKPNKICIGNINFAIGLINSDGYFVKRLSSGCRVLSFNNTVRSIIDSLKKCLYSNAIYYKERPRNRPSNIWKKSYDIWIERQKDIDKLIDKSCFNLKKMRVTK